MKAPEFCLPNQDETEICLRDLVGKWIILYFYPKDNTPGCTKEACDFSEALEEFEDLDAIILGVSPDSPKKHRNFIEKKNLKITLLSDENKEVIKKYGAWGIKKMYGKEYEGVIRSTFIINPQREIVAEFKNVRVKGHIDKVKEKLKELQSGI
jgi:peroxiredoxin Q/BCP